MPGILGIAYDRECLAAVHHARTALWQQGMASDCQPRLQQRAIRPSWGTCITCIGLSKGVLAGEWLHGCSTTSYLLV